MNRILLPMAQVFVIGVFSEVVSLCLFCLSAVVWLWCRVGFRPGEFEVVGKTIVHLFVLMLVVVFQLDLQAVLV